METRTSQGWTARRPGNLDRLNLRHIYPGADPWNLPVIAPTQTVPDSLVAFGSEQTPQGVGATHFFTDDYRFETVWNRPKQGLTKIKRLGCSLSPDFSLWTDMPAAAQLWNVYRNRWCAAYWQNNGVDVIPTVSWADIRSWAFCFNGLPHNSTVAVSTVGIVRNSEARTGFLEGFRQMMYRLTPTTVLVYGTLLPEISDLTQGRRYPARWEGHRPDGR